MDPNIAVLGVGAGIGLAVYAVLAQIDERKAIRESLRHLEGFESVNDTRDRELLNPLRDRALTPMLGAMTRLGRRYTPIGYVDSVRRKHTLAGLGTTDAVDRFLATRVATVVAVPVVLWLMLGLNPLGMGGKSQLAVTAMLCFTLGVGPDAVLNRKVADRQAKVLRQLPDILDLLTISVEAGLGFEQALDRTINAVPGPLTDEFARMLGETRAGASRAEAMRALEARIDIPEVRSFVLAILQADTFGISIGRVMRSQSEEMRIRRRQLAQEKAQKAPVKMLIPMVFCVFPALFVVVIGPAMINIKNNL
jgi:tight adherence protein C